MVNDKKTTTAAPLFIVGAHRSGTTLLQVLLDSKTNIAIPPESHIFDRFSHSFRHYTNLEDAKNLRIFVNDLITDGMLNKWDLNITTDHFCERLKEPSIPNCIRLLFEIYAENHGKTRWGDKTPNNMFHLQEIKSFFPDAKFIHIIRDGRDVAESQLRMWFGPKTIYHVAKKWKTYLSAFDAFKEQVPETEYREIYYEKLVNHPESHLKELLEFLDENPQDLTTEVLDSDLKGVYLKMGSEHDSLSKPISNKKVGFYKKVFTPREIAVFESIAGDVLTKNGYERATEKNVPINPLEAVYFILKDFFLRVYSKLKQPAFLRKRWQMLSRSFLLKIKKQ